MSGLAHWERRARAALGEGRWAWLAGGSGDERTLAANAAAFAGLRLRPRTLAGGRAPSTATTLFGTPVTSPVVVAPVGHQRVFHPQGESATAQGAAAAGTVACLPMLSNTPLSEVAARVPAGVRWQQLYWLRDAGAMAALCDLAEAHGARALVLTVDSPRRAARTSERRAGFRLPPACTLPDLSAVLGTSAAGTLEDHLDAGLTWRRVEQIAGATSLPLVLKGVLSPCDAAIACACGAAGIVVSNHGGRQLDGAIATVDALPRVAEAVGGRLPVLVDGGVRHGAHVAAAMALGADAVMVGRPPMWGLAVGGAQGVSAVLEELRAQLREALTLLGVRAVTEPAPKHVERTVTV